MPADATEQPPVQREEKLWTSEQAPLPFRQQKNILLHGLFVFFLVWNNLSTHSPAGGGLKLHQGDRFSCQSSRENHPLVPVMYLHGEASYLRGNPLTPIPSYSHPSLTPLMSLLCKVQAHTRPSDLLVSHRGSVGGRNVALTACGCRYNREEFTVAVGQNK